MATRRSRGASEPAGRASGLKRTGLLLAIALIAVLMLRDSLAYVVRPVSPGLALRINPGNSEVAESRAEQLLREDPANRAAAETLARQALRRSPVAAAGARMLAVARDVAGDPSAARRLITYSESVSRRDLPTQVWLIQDAVQHDDVPRALHHYDIALRSSEVSKPLLFPVLIKALGQPAVVKALVDTISLRPQWAASFLQQASQEGQDMDGLAGLITRLARRGYAVPQAVLAVASGRMAEAGRYDAAWQVYAAGGGHAVRGAIRDPEFARFGMDDGPFGWTIVPGDGLSVEPRRYGAVNALSYRAATGVGGPIARQLLMLPVGGFRLSGQAPDRATGVPASLRLICAGAGQMIASIEVKSPAFGQGLTVPVSCPAQLLEIVIDGGDDPLGSTGAVGNIHIVSEATH